jgi:site-specific DNA-adenine methylase
MKARFLFFAAALFLSSVFSSCVHFHHHDDVAVSIQEDEEEYRLNARYNDDKTMAVDNYIKTCTESNGQYRYGGHGNFDATITLDDNSQVYIKSRRGRLKIKFDKETNSEEAYEKVRDMCEGIKDLLAEN